MSVDKRTIRAAMRARRRSLPPADVVAAGSAICEQLLSLAPFQAARALVTYLAHENEVSTDAIVAAAVYSGLALYLPRSESVPMLAPWHPEVALERGLGGTQQPVGPGTEHFARPAVMLLPVVAWDVSGTRLGRGGGFYDRLIARLGPGIVRVGLAYEFQEISHVPREAWDAAMHYVVTERRIVQCAAEHMQERELLEIQKGGRQLA